MKTNEGELKRTFRECIHSSPKASALRCPSSETIWSLFSGEGSRKRKARIVDHITTCADCHKEFEAFLEIFRAEEKFAHDVQPQSRSHPIHAPTQAVWRYAAAFLGIIVIASAAVLTTRWLSPKPPAERGRLSGQLRLLAPGQELSFKKPLVFRWEATADTEYYVLEVFDESLLPFWRSGPLTETQCELPILVKEKMARGKDYFWMLSATQRDGKKTESSIERITILD